LFRNASVCFQVALFKQQIDFVDAEVQELLRFVVNERDAETLEADFNLVTS
jgi:hypothetical protein